MKKLTSLAAAVMLTAPMALPTAQADPPEPLENAAERTEQVAENAVNQAENAAERAEELADEAENEIVEDRAERREDRMEERAERIEELGEERAEAIEDAGAAFDIDGAVANRRGLGVYLGGDANRVTVDSVQPNSPAYAAGLRSGDEIIAIDDRPTNGRDRFISDVGRFSEDRPMRIRYRRAGEERTANATLRSYNDVWSSQSRRAARPNYERMNQQPNRNTNSSESGGLGIPDRQDASPLDLENAAEEVVGG